MANNSKNEENKLNGRPEPFDEVDIFLGESGQVVIQDSSKSDGETKKEISDELMKRALDLKLNVTDTRRELTKLDNQSSDAEDTEDDEGFDCDFLKFAKELEGELLGKSSPSINQGDSSPGDPEIFSEGGVANENPPTNNDEIIETKTATGDEELNETKKSLLAAINYWCTKNKIPPRTLQQFNKMIDETAEDEEKYN